MIIAIGTDILEIRRLEQSVGRSGEAFLRRFLTEEELEYARSRGAAFLPHCAGRWAAKEAVAKMLGTGFGAHCSWQDITIRNLPSGAPQVILQGAAKQTADSLGIKRILISISHEQNYCTATVIGTE